MGAASRRNTEYQELFSFDWQFSLGDMPQEQAQAGEGEWRNVQLPHDWSTDYPYYDDPQEHGICSYVVRGIGWYRKEFKVPASSKGKKLNLMFEGCYVDTSVYVNGKLATQWYCGYLPFEADITDLVNYGGDNVVTVRVDNSVQPNSRWYTGSGLYRDVWLQTLCPVHVEEGGTQLILESLTETAADYSVYVDFVNETDEPQEVTLRVDRSLPIGCVLQPHEVRREHSSITLDRPKLWSPEDPNLYTMVVELFIDGKQVDQYDTVFGVRSIEFDAKKGMLINGVHTKLMGVGIHQEGGCVGAAVPKKIWTRRLKKLKEAGFNGVRTGHNPPDESLIEVCDELGFLVLDEAFDEWKIIKGSKTRNNPGMLSRGYGEKFDTDFEKDIITFVKRDRNHPSVAIWSSGNEIVDQVQASGIERAKTIVDIFHTYDPTRPVTLALDCVAAEPSSAREELIDALDIVGYNYVSRWRERAETFYDADKLLHPNWLQLGTEHSPVRGPIHGGYGKKEYWTHPVEPSELFRFTLTRDFVIGDYLWTGVDYLGEAMWPSRIASGAILDICGFPRDSFWFYKGFLNKSCETLHLVPHWNMDVPEGTIRPVLCYTSCDTVELFVNGKSYGKKSMVFPMYGNATGKEGRSIDPTTGNMWLDWDVAYHPGVVKAVGYKNGVQVAEAIMETVGAPKSIELTQDGPLVADGRDIAHVEITVVDEKGRRCPNAALPLTAKVTGAGTLLAFDAGQADSHEMFNSPNTVSVNGRALLIVRAGREAGDIRVELSGEGIEGAIITIPVQ